jgi:hypothetical protein
MNQIGGGHSFKRIYEALAAYFDTCTNRSQYVNDWSNTTFGKLKRENPTLSNMEVLELLIDKLPKIQRALGVGYQDEQQLLTTIRRACGAEDMFMIAVFANKTTYGGLCDDLRTACSYNNDRKALREKELLERQQHQQFTYDGQGDRGDPHTFYTDRRYATINSNSRNFSRPPPTPYQGGDSRPRGGYQRSRNPAPRRPYDSSSAPPFRNGKKCFVCHKEGCWSTNHPPHERTSRTRQYVSSIESVDGYSPSHDEVASYVQSFEGLPEGNSDDDTVDKRDDDSDHCQATVSYLTSASYLHRATGEDVHNDDEPLNSEEPEEDAHVFVLDDRYRSTYQGELWDTGAARWSTVGKPQLEAYVRENPQTKVDWTPSRASISFGDQGGKGSIGSVKIASPIGTVEYHILDTNTPFLLSLRDADKLGAFFNNVENVIYCKNGRKIPVIRKWGHPFFNVSKE